MELVLYDDLEEFIKDIVKFLVIENKNVEKLLKEFKQLKVITIFFDAEDGKFLCYMWLKNKKIKKYEIIDSITCGWAQYCGIDDADTLTNLKTCSLVNYSILEGLNL